MLDSLLSQLCDLSLCLKMVDWLLVSRLSVSSTDVVVIRRCLRFGMLLHNHVVMHGLNNRLFLCVIMVLL